MPRETNGELQEAGGSERLRQGFRQRFKDALRHLRPSQVTVGVLAAVALNQLGLQMGVPHITGAPTLSAESVKALEALGLTLSNIAQNVVASWLWERARAPATQPGELSDVISSRLARGSADGHDDAIYKDELETVGQLIDQLDLIPLAKAVWGERDERWLSLLQQFDALPAQVAARVAETLEPRLDRLETTQTDVRGMLERVVQVMETRGRERAEAGSTVAAEHGSAFALQVYLHAVRDNLELTAGRT